MYNPKAYRSKRAENRKRMDHQLQNICNNVLRTVQISLDSLKAKYGKGSDEQESK
jgi:hypothetical protein